MKWGVSNYPAVGVRIHMYLCVYIKNEKQKKKKNNEGRMVGQTARNGETEKKKLRQDTTFTYLGM